jgi:hypothetical protein
MELENLYKTWIEAKEAEAKAIEERRTIEEEMTKALDIPDTWEGSYTMQGGPFKINVKRAFTRKVDGDKLQIIAEANALSDQLSVLFRWKPEVDMKNWKKANDAVTALFNEAITIIPGRISFKIEEVA